MMKKFKALSIITSFWRPNENYLDSILKSITEKISDGDFLVISEKAISTASNNIIDENTVDSSLSSIIISKIWMKIVWGYLLGVLCHFNKKFINNLRNYPTKNGAHHKQVCLQYTGFLDTLMFGSEGGIDGSNLAYSYVSLPLKNGQEIAENIRIQIWKKLKKKIVVMIVDTDKTYNFRNFYFTPLHHAIRGVHSGRGILAYLIGRMFKLQRQPTPIAVAGCKISIQEATQIARIANRKRGSGAGRTVWDMAERFKIELNKVSWEMLERIKHKPIVLIRKK